MPKPQEVMVSAVLQQQLRLKGLDTSWYSCDFPDACPVCSWTCQQKEGCVRTPRFLSWPDSCQCVTDIKVAHRTLSLCLMPSKERVRGKVSLQQSHGPEETTSVIRTWAQIRPSNPLALCLCSLLWGTDAAQSLLPSGVLCEGRKNAGMGRIFAQSSRGDHGFITD